MTACSSAGTSTETPRAGCSPASGCPPSRAVFDEIAGRIGATVAGRNTYDDSDSFGWSHPPALPSLEVRKPVLEPDIRRLLGTTAMAHLATVLPDGSPHSVPVFVGAEGDRIAFFTGPGSRKAKNLRRDPRVALSL